MKSLLSTALLLASFYACAQLAAGDVAFVLYNSDNPDSFAFVALTDIADTEDIVFTDNGWQSSGSFRSGEQELTWSPPIGGITAGTVVTINNGVPTTGTVSGNAPLFSVTGDQLFAFQGTLASPTLLAGIQMNGAWDADATSANNSAEPPALSGNNTSFDLFPEVDNAAYNASTLMGDQATLLAAINNAANWNTDNTSNLTFSSTFTVLGSPSVGWDEATDTQFETDATFNVLIPVTLTDFGGSQVDLSVTVTGGTAEAGDFTLNTTSLSFTSSSTSNVSIDLNPDAGSDNETIEITLAETTSTGTTISTPVHTITLVDDEGVFLDLSIARQSFESANSDNWGFTPSPAAGSFSASDDVWEVVSSLGTLSDVPSDGANFFGAQDIENPDNLGGTATLTFDAISLTGFVNVSVAFDYEVDGFDNGDDITYEVFVNGVGQGSVLLVDGSSDLNANGTETINIADGTDNVSLTVTVAQNGADDFGGLDNFRITGSASTVEIAGFHVETSSETEADPAFSVNIPVSLLNYGGSQVDLSVSVTGGSAEVGDFTLNTSSLSFTSDDTQNISLTINPDGDVDDETVEITLAETSSTGISLVPAIHTVTISDGVSLPIVLASFGGKVIGDNVLIEWTTASELDNDLFEIYWSTNAKDYALITTLPGAGNSSELLNYNFLHRGSSFGPNYYFLRQIDFDGAFEDSGLILVRKELPGVPYEVAVQPNPVLGSFTQLILQSPDPVTPATLELYNSTGRTLSRQVIQPQGAKTIHPLLTDTLYPGLYYVKVTQGSRTLVSKILKAQ